jgi:predicted nucleotidyltransferase
MAQSANTLTLQDLRSRRGEILHVASQFGAHNVRIFGSVARGDAIPESDVDILVDIDVDANIGGFAYFGLLADLRRALSSVVGRDVDVIDSAGLRRLREQVNREAVPL